MEDYLHLNKKLWDGWTGLHVHSEFYDMEAFRQHPNSLKPIEQQGLGNVAGKSLLHLQCHFGQDTLSWAKLGAQATGMDISPKAIETAKGLAKELKLPAEFVCSDLYTLPQHLSGQFDIVYTSYGVVGWLPDLNKWAEVIRHFLKPGGTFYMVEFHPFVYMYEGDWLKPRWPYFKDANPPVEHQKGSYAAPDADFEGEYVYWNHALTEVLGGLLGQGLQLEAFEEYPYVPYNCLPQLHEVQPGQWQVEGMHEMLPLLYSVKCKG